MTKLPTSTEYLLPEAYVNSALMLGDPKNPRKIPFVNRMNAWLTRNATFISFVFLLVTAIYMFTTRAIAVATCTLPPPL